VATGRCQVRPRCTATRIASDSQGRITHVEYRDPTGAAQRVDAKVYVVACQAIETARLLLLSAGPRHPRGLANGSGLVGRHLLFSTAAWARATLDGAGRFASRRAELMNPAPWLNRSVHDHYFLRDPATGARSKGGTLEFMLEHPQPIGRALAVAGPPGPDLLWGLGLKRALETRFRTTRQVVVEVFADWLPNSDCAVTLDPEAKDRYGVPVARVKIGKHPRNQQVADRLLREGIAVLEAMGGEEVEFSSRGAPSTNLMGDTCRFGTDPARSVLDPSCRAHEVGNLFVTDGSFLPTGGSVPFTFTLYANAFRVANAVLAAI
jgi:choline dehydrogenase-like flavoprotein